MKMKILSVLLLLVVAVGFSGLASAASLQKLVTPAYDEQVLVTPAYNITVVDVPEHNITVVDQEAYDKVVEDVPAYDITVVDQAAYWIWHCNIHKMVEAVFTPVEHPAVYETVTVVDVEAYDETIVDQEAYDEIVTDVAAYDEKVLVKPAHDERVEQKWFSNWNGAVGWGQAKVNSGVGDYYEVHWASHCGHYDVLVDVWKHVPAEYKIIHHDAVTHVVHHDEVSHVVHHDAVTHEEQQLVSEAWIEQVLVTPAHDEVTNMDVQTAVDGYSDMIAQCTAAVPGWNWIYHPHDEVAEVSHVETVPAVTHVETVPAVTHEEVVPAVTHEETIPAVYKTVHHDAVYVEVEIPTNNNVVPEVNDDSDVAPSDDTIPMQKTGSSPLAAAGIVGAALLVVLGAILAVVRRDDEEEEL